MKENGCYKNLLHPTTEYPHQQLPDLPIPMKLCINYRPNEIVFWEIQNLEDSLSIPMMLCCVSNFQHTIKKYSNEDGYSASSYILSQNSKNRSRDKI